jgi:hypothetical protein
MIGLSRSNKRLQSDRTRGRQFNAKFQKKWDIHEVWEVKRHKKRKNFVERRESSDGGRIARRAFEGSAHCLKE